MVLTIFSEFRKKILRHIGKIINYVSQAFLLSKRSQILVRQHLKFGNCKLPSWVENQGKSKKGQIDFFHDSSNQNKILLVLFKGKSGLKVLLEVGLCAYFCEVSAMIQQQNTCRGGCESNPAVVRRRKICLNKC